MTRLGSPLLRSTAIAVACLAVLVGFWGHNPTGFAVTPVAVALVAAVLTAVRHAEVIASRVGEPFGTLLLALSVTVIEVGLVIALMAGGKPGASTLARDTVFAAVMIVSNLVIGLSVVVGALRHRVVTFSGDATSGLLATMATLAAVTLVLPGFTTSTAGRTYSGTQLAFAAVSAIVLYAVFVVAQTVLDRDVFADGDAPHHDEPGRMRAHVLVLLVCLVAVVGLAKTASGAIEDFVHALGATKQLEGVVLAGLVLLPETIAALRAARRNRLQTSINLALGSGIASIGLTVPAIALASVWIDTPLVLGLEAKELVLLLLTVVVSSITLSRGRASILNGAIHVVLMMIVLFLTIEP